MKKIWIIFLFLTTSIYAYEFKNFTHNNINYSWDETEDYEEAIQVYVKAFRHLYSKLHVEKIEEHFQQIVPHELNLAANHPEKIHWLIAKHENKMVGLMILELFNYPEIYVRELTVLPEYQKQGIGTTLYHALLRDIPEFKKIHILTRRINEPAIAFWKKLGFEITDYCHPEYDPNRYLGMELVNKN